MTTIDEFTARYEAVWNERDEAVWNERDGRWNERDEAVVERAGRAGVERTGTRRCGTRGAVAVIARYGRP